MIRTIIAGMIIWVTSISVVYWQTRTKWEGLGKSTGEIIGRADVFLTLCEFASSGPTHLQPDASIYSKASVITLRRKGNLVEIRCK